MDFLFPVRVYYEDTDAGGIVYHANYLKFCERARTEYLRHLGVEQDDYLKQNIAFVVKSMKIDFKVAAKFNDELVVKTEIQQIKRASVEFLQTIINKDEQSVFVAEVQVACINLTKMKPSAMPSGVLGVLQSASRN